MHRIPNSLGCRQHREVNWHAAGLGAPRMDRISSTNTHDVASDLGLVNKPQAKEQHRLATTKTMNSVQVQRNALITFCKRLKPRRSQFPHVGDLALRFHAPRPFLWVSLAALCLFNSATTSPPQANVSETPKKIPHNMNFKIKP